LSVTILKFREFLPTQKYIQYVHYNLPMAKDEKNKSQTNASCYDNFIFNLNTLNKLGAKRELALKKNHKVNKTAVTPNCNFTATKRYNIVMHRIVVWIPQSNHVFEHHRQHRPILRKCDIASRLLTIKSDRSATPAELLV